MAKEFSVDTEQSRFNLPRKTREQIKALILDLDMNATDVVIRAVAELYQREIGGNDELQPDIFEMIAQLTERVQRLEARGD